VLETSSTRRTSHSSRGVRSRPKPARWHAKTSRRSKMGAGRHAEDDPDAPWHGEPKLPAASRLFGRLFSDCDGRSRQAHAFDIRRRSARSILEYPTGTYDRSSLTEPRRQGTHVGSWDRADARGALSTADRSLAPSPLCLIIVVQQRYSKKVSARRALIRTLALKGLSSGQRRVRPASAWRPSAVRTLGACFGERQQDGGGQPAKRTDAQTAGGYSRRRTHVSSAACDLVRLRREIEWEIHASDGEQRGGQDRIDLGRGLVGARDGWFVVKTSRHDASVFKPCSR